MVTQKKLENTRMTIIFSESRKRLTANTGFASGGVTCKLGALCFYLSVVLVDSFVLRNPPERKARKRCGQKKNGHCSQFVCTGLTDF